MKIIYAPMVNATLNQLERLGVSFRVVDDGVHVQYPRKRHLRQRAERILERVRADNPFLYRFVEEVIRRTAVERPSEGGVPW